MDTRVCTSVLRVVWTLLAHTRDKRGDWVVGLHQNVAHVMSRNITSEEVQCMGCGVLGSLALWDNGGDGGELAPTSALLRPTSPRSRINSVIGEEGLGLVLFAVYVALDSYAKNERVQTFGVLALANLSTHPLAQASIVELGTCKTSRSRCVYPAWDWPVCAAAWRVCFQECPSYILFSALATRAAA